MGFDPRYDTPMTDDQCKASERAFLRRLGLRNMDELNKIFEENEYDVDKIMAWHAERIGNRRDA